jgi:cell division protein FtsW
VAVIQALYRDIKGDKAIWMIVAILALASILAVYSATGSMAYKLQDGDTEHYLIQQLLFLGAGAIFTYICYQLHYLQYSRFAQVLLFITIPLLIYTIGFGEEINDAKRWINIPWINKTFQTSDLAKLVLIIYVARAISLKQDVIKDWKSAFLPIIIPVIVVCGLILPSDLSTAALLFVTCVLMMFVGRVHLKYIFGLVGLGAVLLATAVILGAMFPEVIRLETWVSRVNEFLYNTDGGYQIQQSKIAIASGEWFGVGPGNSVQRNYLPYPYADFIYAIICEEYGLFGGLVIIVLYLALLFRCTAIVTQCPKTFGSILAFGLGISLVIQAFANLAVSVHLVPVTGLTLPLVSMGGTSVLFTCISLGIILSVSKYVEEARQKKIELNEMEIIDADNY